ncbi:Sporulation related domain-containing protein [Roseovarius litoreus]|uniref:Sporulation related domain-containing protein n=1 Tax=Roseovarius litoreus TaxID=1155722 RepID=A0A1M7GQ35_9RHOB|nr:SPOR domain-containing protein [Roseovarius litoreus]SHM18009.1 Sporulation related domain-containing protein [Roseovarius litoreus]
MADRQDVQHSAAPGQGNSIAKLTNFAGAAISLALVVGIGVWGYKLLVRDVSGVPVVRAAEGPMRVQPEDPGGRQAPHQGLAVNAVAAEGTAERPADKLILAPRPLELTLEDIPQAELSALVQAPAEPIDETETVADAEPAPAIDERLTDEDRAVQLVAVEALAARMADGVEPLQALEEPAPSATPEPLAATDAASADGIGRSLRPKQRPASLGQVKQAALTIASSSDSPREIAPEDIPVGTRLAQLGAFSSPDIARKEWDRLDGRFGEYLDGKDRVIQKAQSGGRTFYRLRAMGFADINDARRFCSALVAENAECIPVVTR